MTRLLLASAALLLAAPAASAAPYTSQILTLPGGDSGFAVEIADADADGRADVVVGGRAEPGPGGRVWIYPGDGAGALGTPRELGFDGQTEDIEVADVDGDGKAEIVVLAGTAVHVFKAGQAGTPVKVESAESIAIGDVTGDGKPDIVLDKAFGGGQVLAGDGAGGFAATPLGFHAEGCIRGPGDLFLGDLDRSGTLDVGVVNFCTAKLSIGLNGGGAFTQAQPVDGPTYAARLGHLDSDGILDLVGTTGGRRAGRIFSWRGNGNGSFTRVRTWHDRHGFFDLGIADADGDGRNDVIASQSFDAGPAYDDRGFTVLRGDGAGSFTSQLEASLPLDKSVFDLATGDLDGDGRADAAGVLNYDARKGQVAILRRIRVDEPLRGARLARTSIAIGGRGAVRVQTTEAARVTVEVIPKGGGRPVRLVARRLPAGSTTLRFTLRPSRRGETRLKSGNWQVRVAAEQPGVRASRRLAFAIP